MTRSTFKSIVDPREREYWFSQLFLKIVVEVKVGSFNPNVVLTGQTKDSFNRGGGRSSWSNRSDRTLSNWSSNWSCNWSRGLRGWWGWGWRGWWGWQGVWNRFLDEWSQLWDDLGDQVRVTGRGADRWDLLLGHNGSGRSNKGSGAKAGTGSWSLLVDGNETFLNISSFKISIGSGCVAHGDEGSQRVNIAVKVKVNYETLNILKFIIFFYLTDSLTRYLLSFTDRKMTL